MSYRKTVSILVAAAALGVAGCASQDPYQTSSPGGASYPSYPAYPPIQQDVARYGYVESVESVAAEPRSTGPGIGAIGGAIAGGVLGNQVGDGRGQTAATIGGAVIGGVVGHQVEQRVRNNQAQAVEYRFRVAGTTDANYRAISGWRPDRRHRAGVR
jgi:outer membrane lipoprotein SlyB